MMRDLGPCPVCQEDELCLYRALDSLDVLPEYAPDNLLYQRNADAKLPRYSGLKDSSLCHFTDLLDLRFIKARFWVFYPDIRGLSAFGNFVSYVVCICSQKEMVGINAWWIVALVQTVKAVWNWANMKLITQTMRHALDMAYAFLRCNSKLPVTAPIFAAFPFPAFVWAALIYLFPEALFDWPTLFDFRVMAVQKKVWFALDASSFVVSQFDYCSFFATATVTITVRDFIKRKLGLHKLWGKLLHSNSPFMTLLTPPDGSNRRGGNSFPALIIAREGQLCQ